MTHRLGGAGWQARLPASVRQPQFDRSALRSGIVHLGPGAFMRAHLAAMTDDAIEAGAGPGWGICGVSLRNPATRDALQPQQGLYTLALRDADGQVLRIVGSLRESLVAPEDPAAVLQRIAAPEARILSLTITEKGYCRNARGTGLQLDQADIAHDLIHAAAPRSAIGFIVRGLALRRARGLGPITCLSLDNLPGNGDTLRTLVLEFAERVDSTLATWIARDCTFPNSMVDRIVPRTTPADVEGISAALGQHDAWPVLAEPFLDWAVEDRFAAGRPDWRAGGARFVADAAPWERLKLRMVNGAHSAVAYMGVLGGWPTVDVALAQPAMRAHLLALMRDEIEPTLRAGPGGDGLAGLDLAAYRERLLQRFANPALAHRCAQIAMDGSQKLPQRLLATVADRLRAGQPITRLALGLAAWLLHLRGQDEQGLAFALDDPLAPELQALAQVAEALPDDHTRAALFTCFAPVFGGLHGTPGVTDALADALAPALTALRRQGVASTLASLNA